MEQEQKSAFDNYAHCVCGTAGRFVREMDYGAVVRAAELIIAAQERGNRLHISGIGKPAHIAAYAASLLSSTGTPAYFLHGTEAVHGSCGQLVAGDVVIFISNSGKTAEMKATVGAIKNNGCAVIGVTADAGSWLAAESDAVLLAAAESEGGPLDRAPRTSILLETIVLQALSVVLQSYHAVTPNQYVRWHPAGALGCLGESEKQDSNSKTARPRRSEGNPVRRP